MNGETREPETQSLARRARAGEAALLGPLYERLAPSLLAWAALRVRPRLRAFVEPEDLVQETWLRAVRVLPSFDPERSSFRAWLFTVGKNVLLEVQRACARRDRDGPAEGRTSRVLALEHAPDDVTAITRRVARADDVRRFLEAVATLDDIDRAVLVHCELEEMTAREAGALLNLSSDALAKRRQRLRERLRERTPADLFAATS